MRTEHARSRIRFLVAAAVIMTGLCSAAARAEDDSPTPTNTPVDTETPTPTDTAIDTSTPTNTMTSTPTPTPTPMLTAITAHGKLAAGVLCLNRQTGGATGAIVARDGHKTVGIEIVPGGNASVTAECDVADTGTFTTVNLPTGAASSARTTSGAVESDEWCEGGIRLSIANPTPPVYVSGHLFSTGVRAEPR